MKAAKAWNFGKTCSPQLSLGKPFRCKSAISGDFPGCKSMQDKPFGLIVVFRTDAADTPSRAMTPRHLPYPSSLAEHSAWLSQGVYARRFPPLISGHVHCAPDLSDSNGPLIHPRFRQSLEVWVLAGELSQGADFVPSRKLMKIDFVQQLSCLRLILLHLPIFQVRLVVWFLFMLSIFD